jgi:dTDP-4-dehydrorhamnose 3,5-epimerase-like enzyme
MDIIEYRRSEGGDLGVLHFCNLPFKPVRVYWLMNTLQGIARGVHAHKQLEQFFICVSGGVTLELDDGAKSRTLHLLPGGEGLHLEPIIWRSLCFADERSVLLVFASRPYEPDDYIFEYSEFLRLKGCT